MKGFAFGGVEREAKGGVEAQEHSHGALAAWEGCAPVRGVCEQLVRPGHGQAAQD